MTMKKLAAIDSSLEALTFIKKILSCLVFERSRVMKKNQIRFLMKGEKTFFKENIPAFSVQGKSRSISVLQKNLVTIIQNISES
jgi:hypothetical protein